MEEVDPDPEPAAADATGAAPSAVAVAAVLMTVPSLTPAEIKTVERVVGAGEAAAAPALLAAAVAAVEPEPAPRVAEKAAACWLKPDAAAALALGVESPKPQPPLVSRAMTEPEQVPARLGPNAQQPEAHSESEAQVSGMDLSWARVRVVRERRSEREFEKCMMR